MKISCESVRIPADAIGVQVLWQPVQPHVFPIFVLLAGIGVIFEFAAVF